MESLANLALRRPRNTDLPTLGRDALAGAISAVVQIAYCISFSALIFQGALASGFSLGLAAIIMGTVFAAFILSTDRIPKEFGFLLAVAILTDALIVRMNRSGDGTMVVPSEYLEVVITKQ